MYTMVYKHKTMPSEKTAKKHMLSLIYEQIQQLCELYKSEETLWNFSSEN